MRNSICPPGVHGLCNPSERLWEGARGPSPVQRFLCVARAAGAFRFEFARAATEGVGLDRPSRRRRP